jgi:glycosyltransferase involved in cell wall biosynthesis
MESVLGPLSVKFEVTLFATNHRGPAEPRPFAVRTNRLAGDAYGYEQLPALLDEYEPDLVLFHRDARFYAMHRDTLEAYRASRPDTRVVVYCPADWPRPPAAVPSSLADVDALVMYTQFGLRTIERAFRRIGLAPPRTRVIPHGVDSERFAPLVPGDPAESRAEARRRLFPGEPGIGDAFVVLNANRNQRRKRIDLTLRGFATFAHDRPDARLYLHMGMRDLGCDVPRLAGELGIADRLLTTTREPAAPHVPDEHLNLIYNACDVGLNTAAAEGWGLVSFEHAAAGAPQVVPDHGACAELWRGRTLLVPTSVDREGGRPVSPEGVAAALALLHDDGALRAELARRARSLATSPQFDWSAIAARWEDLLTDCLRGEGSLATMH